MSTMVQVTFLLLIFSIVYTWRVITKSKEIKRKQNRLTKDDQQHVDQQLHERNDDEN